MQDLNYQPFDLNADNDAALDVEQVQTAVEQRGYCDFLFRHAASAKSFKSERARCLVCDAVASRFRRIDEYDYWKCGSCGHIFIDREQSSEFGKDFYNSAKYKAVAARWPQEERLHLFKIMMVEIETVLGRKPQSVLDFGAGSEDIAEKRQISSAATFYDPYFFVDEIDQSMRFDAIIATEVLEHLFDPTGVLRELRGYSDMVFATTLLSDLNFTPEYLMPSGGHVSIFSTNSIALAAQAAGFDHEIVHWSDQSDFYYHRLIAK
ncbi:MAG: methyltransferase domain-containing protein, partial [Methylocystis sp.]